MDRTGLIALVAGGAGFVGSHLCRRLHAMGCARVVCLDSLVTGSKANVADLLGSPRFSFVLHDVVEPLDIEGAVDEIYNLACPASPVQYGKDPIHTFLTSVLGSRNLLELAEAKGSRVLLASTSEVYGDPSVSPQSETYWGNVNPYGVRSCYDEGKRGAETLFRNYCLMRGVDTRVIRIFNTYGPLMNANDGRVISNFVVNALRGESLVVHGDGSQTRSFQYIDDLIDAILLMMGDGVTHSPVNIGNDTETPISEVAQLVLNLTGSASPVTHAPLPEDDPCRRKPDISLASRELGGWRPRVSLQEGLLRTIEYFRGIVQSDRP